MVLGRGGRDDDDGGADKIGCLGLFDLRISLTQHVHPSQCLL